MYPGMPNSIDLGDHEDFLLSTQAGTVTPGIAGLEVLHFTSTAEPRKPVGDAGNPALRLVKHQCHPEFPYTRTTLRIE
eukprot:28912-Rhodomonas_salina.1